MSEEFGRRKGLGRGLSALIQDDGEDLGAIDRMRDAREVPIEQLSANPYQPRQSFGDEELIDLSNSIKEKGILMPILVRRVAGEAKSYQIIAGERRWRAAQMAQLHDVPVLVRDMDDKEALEVAIIENVQRENLSPIDEASGYKRLMKEFEYTQADVGKIVGKSRPHIANMLRLLQLPLQVQNLLEAGHLTPGHARTLINAEDPVAMADEIMRSGLNVRQSERLAGAGGRRAAAAKDPNLREVERQLEERLGLKVTITQKGEGGEVRIGFHTLEQFDDILMRLHQAPQ
jgi:ParB family chromosome partitioning protein